MNINLYGLQNAEFYISKLEAHLYSLNLQHIHKGYVDGKVASLLFQVPVSGQVLSVKLPLRWHRVKKRFNLSDERAYRVACELMTKWVEKVVELVLSGNIHLVEAFLPYLYNDNYNATLFDAMSSNEFRWG